MKGKWPRGPVAGGLQPAARRRSRRHKGLRLLVAFAVIVLGLRIWPHAPLQARVPVSTGVWSADGELLRVTLAADEQYRLWVPLEEISPTLVDAILLKEDRWFYLHPGVNPVALSRAAFRTYSGGNRQGGSTLTMQLARLLYRLNTRTPTGKAKQAALALWLECRYSKHDLLEAYLNVAPFGGNIEGVGAASRIFFGKSPDRLTLGESLTLAVIPQRPAGRAGRSADGGDVLAAREQLGRAWLQAHPAHGDRADAERRQVELPIVARPDYSLPWKAPHFVDALLAGGNPGDRVDTTLESRLQRVLETQIRQFIAERGENGLRNAAAVLVDTRDMGVKAWVGAADYWNARDGQVNGVLARRSPGSALKPFIYALALDQGLLHPRTMLRDAPSAFGPFTPENFDGRFMGPITAQEALIRSRNIPAVWASSQLRQPSLYQFLESAGIRDLKPEAFYGLALALGGGEVTMEELAGLYAMLANGGVLKPIRMTAASVLAGSGQRGPKVRESGSYGVGVRLLSAEASFITLDMLRHNPRPGDTGLAQVRTEWPVAWKTGTSWGFRDAWTAGVAGPYVLVVWIGNFSGEGNPAFVGVDAAAPLFFRMVNALNLARPSEDASLPVPPGGVTQVAVCVGSGDLPNADCPHTADTWYIPGKSPIRVSQLHRAVAVDPATGVPVCAPYAPNTRFEVFEFWSSDMLTLFREAGMPRRVPPPLPACALDDRMEPPRIASPMRNVSYTLRSSTADAIPLEASVAADVQRLFWFDGNALIGSRTPADGPLSWRPVSAGTRIVRVVDDHGRSADRDVTVTLRR
jgi:penicillin-binding protein 1C